MGVYSSITFGKAVIETFTLNKDIKKHEDKIRKHLLNHLQGAKRYEAAETLFSIALGDALCAAGSDQKKQLEIKYHYLDRLRDEYEMSKETLSKELANKAEVVALGLALREVALSLDDEIEKFRKNTVELRDRTQKAAEEQFNQYELLRNKASDLFHQLDKQIGQYQDLKIRLQQVEQKSDELGELRLSMENLRTNQEALVAQFTRIEESVSVQKQDFSRFQETIKKFQSNSRTGAMLLVGMIVLNFVMNIVFLVIFLGR